MSGIETELLYNYYISHVYAFKVSVLVNSLNVLLYSKVSRPEKLPVHLFEVDEDMEKDEVSRKVPECSLVRLEIPAGVLLIIESFNRQSVFGTSFYLNKPPIISNPLFVIFESEL